MEGARYFTVGMVILVTMAVLLRCDAAAVAPAERHRPADFYLLPNEQKERIVWTLQDRGELDDPANKPIFRDLIATQSRYGAANAVSWTVMAIETAERRQWRDMRRPVEQVYAHPSTIWAYLAAFHCLRSFDGKEIAPRINAAADVLERAGLHDSPVSDRQLAEAVDQLRQSTDKTAAMVYALKVACWHPGGHGYSTRGREAALEVLRSLGPSAADRLRSFMDDFGDELYRAEARWAIEHLDPGDADKAAADAARQQDLPASPAGRVVREPRR